MYETYPKEFRQRTILDDGGFLKYRIRDNERIIQKKDCILDKSYIVSYNASLLLKYGCYINVEYTCQTNSIQYLFKYVHKQND